MALTQAQLDGATGWLDTQFGGGFNNGQYQPGAYQFNPNNTLANFDILGAGRGMGYGDADIAQILAQRGGNVTPEQIAAFGQQHAGAVDMGRQLFQSPNGYDENVSSDPFYNPPAQQQQQMGGGGATGMPTLQGYQPNPYLDQMMGGLRTQWSQFMNDGLAQNRGNAVANGNVGGSRQGIAEARTMTDASNGFANASANLYGNDYNNSQNRNLQQYGIDTNAYLQNRGLDLTGQGQMLNFYNDGRRLDQSGLLAGAQVYGLAGQNDWAPFLNASNVFGGNYSGSGSTTTGGSSTGGGASGALGGAGAAYQLWNDITRR
jgi:hypothetical protein